MRGCEGLYTDEVNRIETKRLRKKVMNDWIVLESKRKGEMS